MRRQGRLSNHLGLTQTLLSLSDMILSIGDLPFVSETSFLKRSKMLEKTSVYKLVSSD